MRMRFISNLALAVVAVCLVVFTQAFTLGTVAWLSFALAIALLVIALPMLAMRSPGQRAIGVAAALIAAYTIPASVVLVPATVMWIGFSTGVALAVLAAGGLTLHEYTTERVVHSLEVSHAPAGRGRADVNGEAPEREPQLVTR